LPGSLDGLSFLIKNFISSLILAVHAVAYHPGSVIFTRDESVAALLSFFKNNIVFEAHSFSKKRTWLYGILRLNKVKTVAITRGLKEEFLGLKFGEADVLVAADGVDPEEFSPELCSAAEARQRLNLASDKKLAVYTGHLFEWKGVHTLLESSKNLPEVDFIFVGGTFRDVEIFRNKASQASNVKVIGHVPHKDVPAYLRAADVLVLPNSAKVGISERYTSPLKMFEYMASKKPIVATDLPSIREILNEDSAVLVSPDDPAAMARGIKKIISDPSLAIRLSENAFLKVAGFSWKSRASLIASFIHRRSI
jgi:glycosyltransferase involved in cell wall biosynthesis